MRTAGWLSAALALLMVAAPPLTAAEGPAAVSEWVNGHNSRARVLAGRLERSDGLTPYAFVEIEMQPGWKTYWRSPGDAGGVPPQFDWSQSENIADMKVMYPAPTRIKEEAGDAVGYLDHVMFPIALKARDAGKPIKLAVVLEYGVCKEICIPAEARLALDIAPGKMQAVPEEASATLEKVPRLPTALRSGDPRLLSAKAETKDGKQRIVLSARFPGDAARGEAFVEGPDGIYLPLPTRLEATSAGEATFEVLLGPYDDLDDLTGKQLTVTLVGEQGESETKFDLGATP